MFLDYILESGYYESDYEISEETRELVDSLDIVDFSESAPRESGKSNKGQYNEPLRCTSKTQQAYSQFPVPSATAQPWRK